ncbi:MAG: M48 family metallopeptidase [Alkalimonas sp.]|nr:M48 family metallopeptidase [Alkalimonas sp.]
MPPYRLLRSQRRSKLALQVKDGELLVRATPTCTQSQIEHFIGRKMAWIARHLQQQQQQLQQAKRCIVHDGVLLFDQVIPVELKRSSRSAIQLDGDRLLIDCSRRISDEQLPKRLQSLLDSWYQQLAADWFPQRVVLWQHKMQLFSTAVRVKKWRRRWGSCSSKGELEFNWRLMMAPEWVIDYVIVHELAHLQWLDHSASFWQLVRRHYDRMDEARQWLQQHQFVLMA